MEVTFTTEERDLLRKLILNAPMQGDFLTLSQTILTLTIILEKLNDGQTPRPEPEDK